MKPVAIIFYPNFAPQILRQLSRINFAIANRLALCGMHTENLMNRFYFLYSRNKNTDHNNLLRLLFADVFSFHE